MKRVCLNRVGRPLSRRKQYVCGCRLLLVLIAILLFGQQGSAQTKRLVIIKCDGLPQDLVDRFVKERDPITGKSELPWIEHIFYQRGTVMSNFYVRGMSLSAPSWSLLDTGQHLQLKGNVEFDRYTLHSYDYLNFIPLYIAGIKGLRVDMPGVEVLDSLGIPLLPDAYPHDERYLTFSLFLRGARYSTLQYGLENRFKRSPKELFDEWAMGFDIRHALTDELLRELIAKLDDPNIHYLDLMITDFDHAAHHNNDAPSQLFVLKHMDAMIGQVWTAITKSSMAANTAMVLISDHGFNTDESLYSQGFNLVKLLGSRAGGGHHVITKRRLMMDYAIKGINPLVPLITTTTNESFYLKHQSTDYPTAMLDFDGNERAAIQLRDSDLNKLQILFQQLQNRNLTSAVRAAATDEFFQTIDKRRPNWKRILSELEAELAVLRVRIQEQQELWAAQPKKFSPEELRMGRDEAVKRVFVKLDQWQREEREYGNYAATLRKLLSLSQETFEPAKLNVEELISKRSMGDHNTVYKLQNYVAGLSSSGLQLKPDGALDDERSFVRVNYFDLLHGVTVRNTQKALGTHPIDLLAMRLDSNLVADQLNETDLTPDVVWVSDEDKQALLLFRYTGDGKLLIRYQPINNLRQDESGRVSFDKLEWQPGLPLRIYEDPKLAISDSNRAGWLSKWHTDKEWLEALHHTAYSNGLIGLNEELTRHPIPQLDTTDPELTSDERTMRRFLKRQRELCEPEILIVANNHWNFDVRGFNPGGNHGSFFRISTHSVFMIAGGANTGIGQGESIKEPYDSLSFVPTLLALIGDLRDDSTPIPILWDKGFRRFPGPVVKELLPGHDNRNTASTGVSSAP